MDLIWGQEVPGVKRIPVTLSGQWDEVSLQPPWQRGLAWRGVATAEEPLVALTIHFDPERIHWVKSVKYRDGLTEFTELPVTLTIYEYPNASSPAGYPSRFLQFAIASFGVGCWLKNSKDVLGLLPSLQGEVTTQTGCFTEFVKVSDNPSLSFGALFFTRGDVKYARKCIWNLRKRIKEKLDQAYLRKIFTYRRTGALAVGKLFGDLKE